MQVKTRMPWGKFRGKALDEIDLDYLLWVLYEAEAAKPWLKTAIQAELRRRECDQEEADDAEDAVPNVSTVLQKWYREMALKFHPDRTLDDGSAMKAINCAYERLQELLGIRHASKH